MPDTISELTPLAGQQNQQDNKERAKSTVNNTRSNSNRGNNARNSNLAALASAAQAFKGKIEELPIIGKQYESTGVAWEILQKDLAEYVVLKLECGDDIAQLVENMEDKPEEHHGKSPEWDKSNKDDYGAQQLYSKKLDMHLKREAAYVRNKKKVYTILYGQCTPSLLSGIKSADDFSKKDKEKDPIWIMTLIKKLSVGIDETENELCTAFQSLKKFYTGYQKPTESNDDWFDRFNEGWNTAMAAGGKTCLVPKIA